MALNTPQTLLSLFRSFLIFNFFATKAGIDTIYTELITAQAERKFFLEYKRESTAYRIPMPEMYYHAIEMYGDG